MKVRLVFLIPHVELVSVRLGVNYSTYRRLCEIPELPVKSNLATTAFMGGWYRALSKTFREDGYKFAFSLPPHILCM